MNQPNYNTWEIKQILDVVSKGVNSYLMNAKKISLIKCEQLGKGLTQIYKDILADLKNPDVYEVSPDLRKPPTSKESQAMQEKAEELGEAKIKEDEELKAEEQKELPVLEI